MKKLFVLLLLFIPSIVWGAGTCGTSSGVTGTSPYTAETHNYADVADCLTDVAAGSEIIVPAGDGAVDWASMLTVNKSITLTGPGASNLTIKNTQTPGTYEDFSNGKPIIHITLTDWTAEATINITGFTFDNNGQHNIHWGVSTTNATYVAQKKTRIHHNVFTCSNGTSGKGSHLTVRSNMWGLVDHNIFNNSIYPISHTGGSSTQWNDDELVNRPFTAGSANYPYYEDNVFNQPVGGSEYIVTNGEYSSCRYVFRYNTINTNNGYGMMFEVHGTNINNTAHACFGTELYGNYWSTPANEPMVFWAQRGGQSKLFYNMSYGRTSNTETPYFSPYNNGAYDAEGVYKDSPTHANALDMITNNSYWWMNYQKNTDDSYSKFRLGSAWSSGDTVLDQIAYASHTGTSTGTPKAFATGFVPDVAVRVGTIAAGATLDVHIEESDDDSTYTDWVSGAFTQITSADNGTYPHKQYTGSKAYIRAVAVVTGDASTFGVKIINLTSCSGVVGYPKYGRDIVTDHTAYPDASTYSWLEDAAVKVSCGSSLPETCDVGDGYWYTKQSCSNPSGLVGADTTVTGGARTATDIISGTLYKCTSTNTWTAEYTPYAYPHPLRGETVATNYSISGGTISGGSIK